MRTNTTFLLNLPCISSSFCACSFLSSFVSAFLISVNQSANKVIWRIKSSESCQSSSLQHNDTSFFLSLNTIIIKEHKGPSVNVPNRSFLVIIICLSVYTLKIDSNLIISFCISLLIEIFPKMKIETEWTLIVHPPAGNVDICLQQIFSVFFWEEEFCLRTRVEYDQKAFDRKRCQMKIIF